MKVALHEMVHAYNSILNKNMIYWLDNGLAGVLSEQSPKEWGFNVQQRIIPTIKQTQTSNPITFSNIGGYPFSYTYVEFLDDVYGWDNVIILAKSNSFDNAFGKNESAIYDEWIEWLIENYSE